MSEADAMTEAVRADILRAYGLKAWHAGLAPVPWRIRVWRKVSFARWRVRRRIEREDGDG